MMNLFSLLFKPVLPILQKAVDVEIDEKAIAHLVLYLLGGEKQKDIIIATMADKAIKGGKMVEAVDGAIIESYIKKLREWAEAKVKE